MLIQEYDITWQTMFHRIHQVVVEALGGLCISIEHVGSTAVPGLAAKPIIDIDIVFEHGCFPGIVSRLQQIGYRHNGDQGVPGREVFKRDPNAPYHPTLDSIRHHLYACAVDSAELERHILFRDYLRANERARTEYQELKMQLAQETGHDRKKYAALKEVRARSFVYDIVRKSRQTQDRQDFPERVLVIGSGGAGKSTAATKLGKLLNLPVVHLDTHFWKPNWVEPPRDQWFSIVQDLCAKPRWVMDGNYGGTIRYRLDRCDTVVFFLLPRLKCLWRVIKRTLSRKRVDIIPGCKERLNYPFLKWIWTYNRKKAPTILKRIHKLKDKRIYVVKSQKDLNALYRELSTPV